MNLADIKQELTDRFSITVATKAGKRYRVFNEQTMYLEVDDAGACVIGWAVDHRSGRGRKWRYLNPANLQLAN